MSRSFRKTPIMGFTTARSEKQDKRFANRKLRRKTRIAVAVGDGDDVLPVMREVSNVWGFAKDGKTWFGPGRPRPKPFDRASMNKWMRK